MASTQLSHDMAWTTTLHAYDDGLSASRQTPQVLRFSQVSENPREMEQLRQDLRENNIRGTIGLPQDSEIASGSDPKHAGLWVGWYLPLVVLPPRSKSLKGASVNSLVNGDDPEKLHDVQTFSQEQTALKVICRMQSEEVGTRYYALAYPDPETGICKAFFIGEGISVFFHREFRNYELTNTESRGAELRIPIRARITPGASAIRSDQAMANGLQGERILADVYAHVVEYLATKDDRHISAAFRIIEKESESDPTAWIECRHLQKLVLQKHLSSKEAEAAVEELFVVYPSLDRDQMNSLTADVLEKVSLAVYRQPEKYRLTWATLQFFMTGLVVRLKNSPSIDDETIEAAMNDAIQFATLNAEAGASAPSPHQLSDNNSLNFVVMEIKALQRLLASCAGVSTALFDFIKSLPGHWDIEDAAKNLRGTADKATAYIASENYLHTLGMKLKVIQDETILIPLAHHLKKLQDMALSIQEKAEREK